MGGEGSCASILLVYQDAPGMPGPDSHQVTRLVRGNVLREHIVQNLKSCLSLLSQSHFLRGLNVTFLLAS